MRKKKWTIANWKCGHSNVEKIENIKIIIFLLENSIKLLEIVGGCHCKHLKHWHFPLIPIISDTKPNLLHWTNSNENAPLCSGRVTLSVLDLETAVATNKNGSYRR